VRSLQQATATSTGAELPRFIKDEFDAFFACGILAHGFPQLPCGACGHDTLLALVVARAFAIGGTVVTAEHVKQNAVKVPYICKHFDMPWLDLDGFKEREVWEF